MRANTPLAVPRGELEAMEDGIHPITPEALGLLQAEVATLSQFVTDLHELAQADMGALTCCMAALDLAALLGQKATLLRHACAERQPRLDLQAPAGPLLLQADEARRRQLLRNPSNDDAPVVKGLVVDAERHLVMVDGVPLI